MTHLLTQALDKLIFVFDNNQEHILYYSDLFSWEGDAAELGGYTNYVSGGRGDQHDYYYAVDLSDNMIGFFACEENGDAGYGQLINTREVTL